MLEARHLVRRFSGVTAVSDVSFLVQPGEIVGYLGPNGSGKSTTVKMLTGLLAPTSGQVWWEGRAIHADTLAFRRRLGYVPEEPLLYPFLSGREFLQFVGRLRELPDALLNHKIDRMVDLLGLGQAADQSISAYSKGMKQKILLTAALLHDPDVLILDEPDSGLDLTMTVVLRHVVQALARRGKAILYSSHVMDLVERLCSRVIVINHGRIVADDTVDALRALQSSGSLEEVFSQLVMGEDPAPLADQIADVVVQRA